MCQADGTSSRSARRLSQTIRLCTDYPAASRDALEISLDKVLDYACTVLSDGLLLLEFRDATHEGNGEQL